MKRSVSQRGAAMVEFIVGAVFFMVPLYLAIQALGKFADVQHTANGAARYAAWEKTVWFEDSSSTFQSINAANQKSTAQIRGEILARVLNDRRDALVYKNTDKSASTLVNGQDTLWQDTAGTDYLKDASKTTLTASYVTPSKDITGKAIALLGSFGIPGITGTLAPPVPTQTLATTQFKLGEVAKDSDVYKRLWAKSQGLPEDWLGLEFEGRSGILTNTWGANASSGTRGMVAQSTPTASGLGSAMEVGYITTMGAWDLTAATQLDVGKIAENVVPPDRLK
jgi:hypothetical protein